MTSFGKGLLVAALFCTDGICQSPTGLASGPAKYLRPIDATKGWAFPYTAPAERAKRVQEGISIILKEHSGTPISKFIEILGAPDLVEDFSASPHMGLSIREDSMMMQHAQYIKLRVVWFLTKENASTPNLNDSWFAAYISADGVAVYKVMKNNLKL